MSNLEFMSKFKYFSENEQLRFDAISREKYINDQASLERSAKLAGRAEGRAEEKIEVALDHLQEVKDSLLQAQKKYNEWDQASSQLSDDTTGQNMKDQVEKDRAIFGNDLTDLKELEQRGVRILTCGTCLNFYGLSEKLKVGEVTNMYEIAETMSKASLIVSP